MSQATPQLFDRRRLPLIITVVILAIVLGGFFLFSSLYTEVLWFDQVGYLEVLLTTWGGSVAMFLIGFITMFIPVWLSINLAYRFRPVYAKLSNELDRYRQIIDPIRRVAMLGIPALLALFSGLGSANTWPQFLLWMNREPFGTTDPEFGLDVGFYIFELPVYSAVISYVSTILVLSAVGAAATGFLYGSLAVTGREVRISRTMRVQLAVIGVLYFAAQAVNLWLQQYEALVSPSGGFLAFGAGFTEANATIPARAIMAAIAVLVALLFLVTAIVGRWRLAVVGTALYLVSGLVLGLAYPALIQRFQVDPSARTLEAQFIERNIEATRDAYGVSDVVEIAYEASTDTSAGALRADAETTANIRIIDPALVTDAFAQLEQFRQYYRFPTYLDVGRYDVNGERTDTVLAVREINLDGLNSQSWYNNTIVYTHGYGLVAAYGNQRTEDGQPRFIESGIPVSETLVSTSPASTSVRTHPSTRLSAAPKGPPRSSLTSPPVVKVTKTTRPTPSAVMVVLPWTTCSSSCCTP